MTNRPAQEYIEFAQITCNDSDDTWCLNQITKKACDYAVNDIQLNPFITAKKVKL